MQGNRTFDLLATELVHQVFIHLDFFDLLRCTSVNKEWRAIIYGSRSLTAQLWLPLTPRGGPPQAASFIPFLPRSQFSLSDLPLGGEGEEKEQEVVEGENKYSRSASPSQAFLNFYMDARTPYRCEHDLKEEPRCLSSPYNPKTQISLHPILRQFRVCTQCDNHHSYASKETTKINYYALLECLKAGKDSSDRVWRHMYITNSPMTHITITSLKTSHQCLSGAAPVTLGNLIDKIGEPEVIRVLRQARTYHTDDDAYWKDYANGLWRCPGGCLCGDGGY